MSRIDIDDIVVVISSDSIPESFLGRYGRVTDNIGDKVLVEFEIHWNNKGSLSHTAYQRELLKVGVATGKCVLCDNESRPDLLLCYDCSDKHANLREV